MSEGIWGEVEKESMASVEEREKRNGESDKKIQNSLPG